MFRFFIFTVCFPFFIYASGESDIQASDLTFSQKHVYPVLKRGSDRTSLLTFVSGAFAVGLSEPSDDQVRSEWKLNQKISKSDSHIGDLMGTGGVAVLASGLQYYFDDRTYAYESHLRGLVYGGISIYVLKTLAARPRPGNSDNHQSFPSGHTTISFMTATHLTYAYGWKAGVIAYPLAAFVGATRLSDDVHWFSDTVAGAFLGFIVGRAAYYDSEDLQINVSDQASRPSKIKTEVIPFFTSDSTGFTTLVSF
jgi:hypothetical protein